MVFCVEFLRNIKSFNNPGITGATGNIIEFPLVTFSAELCLAGHALGKHRGRRVKSDYLAAVNTLVR